MCFGPNSDCCDQHTISAKWAHLVTEVLKQDRSATFQQDAWLNLFLPCNLSSGLMQMVLIANLPTDEQSLHGHHYNHENIDCQSLKHGLCENIIGHVEMSYIVCRLLKCKEGRLDLVFGDSFWKLQKFMPTTSFFQSSSAFHNTKDSISLEKEKIVLTNTILNGIFLQRKVVKNNWL